MSKTKYNQKQTNLTTRQKAIIQMLTQFTTEYPATISLLSERLHCSSRTVLREMPIVENWLKEHKFSFFRKPGVGVILNEDADTKQQIFDVLEETEKNISFGKEERRKWILGELLYAKDPLKSYYFTKKYKISEGTFSHDLDFLSQWLQKYELEIVRKSGIGIFVEGTESAFRQAIANAVYEFMSEKEILDMLCGHKENKKDVSVPIKYRDMYLLDHTILQTVELVLSDVEKSLQIQYPDSAYIGLLVHISLAVKRLQNKEIIHMETERLHMLKQYPEYTVAQEIAKGIDKMFQLHLPEDEIGYIALHCIHTNIWYDETDVSVDNMQMRQCVKNMVMAMQKELMAEYPVVLLQNETIILDLCQYMTALLHRLTFHIPIQNAQLSVFRERYENIYQATIKSCTHLKPLTKGATISAEEIGYIAMYFCTALEKQQNQIQKIPVVVVCPTGFGTSKMLAVHLQKTFPELDIKEIVSIFRVDTAQLKKDGIRLVISTVHLDIDFLHIQVNPILLEQDKIALRKMLSTLPMASSIQKNKKTLLQKQDILQITQWGQEIVDFLDNIKWLTISSITKKEDLVAYGAKLFAKDLAEQTKIVSDLQKRETLASTYIGEFQMLLLHCRTQGVAHCCFGYIKLQNPFFHKEGMIQGAIVMLIPEKANQICVEIIQHISGELIENEALFQAIQQKGEKELQQETEKSLIQYYQKMILKRLECVT